MAPGDVVDEWRTKGFAILPGFLSTEELSPAIGELATMFPTPEGFHDGTDERRARYADDEFDGIDTFPFISTEFSMLAVHPRIVDLAETLLEQTDLRLSSAEAWAKYTGATSYDQGLASSSERSWTLSASALSHPSAACCTRNELIDELSTWLQQQSIDDVGPFFLRLHVIDMSGPMDLEVGVITPRPMAGDARVRAAILPAGRYATLTYRNHSLRANRALLDWAGTEDLMLDRRDVADGQPFRLQVRVVPHGSPQRTPQDQVGSRTQHPPRRAGRFRRLARRAAWPADAPRSCRACDVQEVRVTRCGETNVHPVTLLFPTDPGQD